MITPDTGGGAGAALAAPFALRQARNFSDKAVCLRLWLGPADRRRLREVAGKVAALTGQRASTNVLLRAGIAALEECADKATAEKLKRPGSRGQLETSILWWVSSAARINANSEGEG
jgi:hypothetical protein